MTDATPITSRAGSSRPSMRAPSTARRVSGSRGGPGSVSVIRPLRSSSVPSSMEARTVSPMNSGLPSVRSWISRASSASRAARATIVASWAVSGGASPSSCSRSTCGWSAQAGAWPGRIVAMTTSARSGGRRDDELDHPRARGVDPVDVVEDDDARSVGGQDPVEVGRGDVAEGGAVSAGSSGTSAASASQPVNAASRATAAIAPP